MHYFMQQGHAHQNHNSEGQKDSGQLLLVHSGINAA